MLGLSDDQLALRLRCIRACCPDLAITSVRVPTDSQRSDVLVINDALVFRFAGTQAGVQALATEVAILRAMAGRLPLPIPDPQYEHSAMGPGDLACMGYRWLPGHPLRPATLRALDGATQRQLAMQLGGFLAALHTLPLEVLPAGLPVHDGADQWLAFYARVRASLFPSMRADARRAVERHVETYLGDATHTPSFRPTLRHGDFGPTNILFDPSARTIVGIIDFGSAGLGDPATDIAGLLSPVSYGEAFVELLAPSYAGLADLLGRARFYVGTFALQEALWGFEHGDSEALRRGLAQYV